MLYFVFDTAKNRYILRYCLTKLYIFGVILVGHHTDNYLLPEGDSLQALLYYTSSPFGRGLR
jgi:hypothetical protein